MMSYYLWKHLLHKPSGTLKSFLEWKIVYSKPWGPANHWFWPVRCFYRLFCHHNWELCRPMYRPGTLDPFFYMQCENCGYRVRR